MTFELVRSRLLSDFAWRNSLLSPSLSPKNKIPKGYLVANIRVADKEKFAEFVGMAGPAIKKYGGKVLAKGPSADRLEGEIAGIVMMIEFESKEAANTFYHSEEYQAAKAIRETCSDTDLMIIEGLE